MAHRRDHRRGHRRNPRGMLGGLLSSDLVTVAVVGGVGYYGWKHGWFNGISCMLNPQQTKCKTTTTAAIQRAF